MSVENVLLIIFNALALLAVGFFIGLAVASREKKHARVELLTSRAESITVLLEIREGIRIERNGYHHEFWTWEEAVQKLCASDKPWARERLERYRAEDELNG